MRTAFALAALLVVVACSDDSGPNDGGADAQTCVGPAASGALAGFTPPVDPGGGGIVFTASGEALALSGYPFPPANAGDPAFVDGWDVRFTRVLVTIDKLALARTPDFSAGDESAIGDRIAEVDGPWAVDLAHADPSDLPGKGGGGERAVPIAALAHQSAFATDGTRYAFGFDLIAATAKTCDGRATMNVNLDQPALADYANMVSGGCVVYYAGVATFKGDRGPIPTCNDDPEYATWPKTIAFGLCFQSPTTYVNCQNPDNDPAKPLPNEEHERGLALLASQSVIAQVTVHTDHPFWDSVLHDSPLHFDQFAARLSGQADAGAPLATLELTRGVDYTAYTDAQGKTLAWRYCIDPPTDVHPKFTGIMSFDRQSTPPATNGDPATGLRDYDDFATYNQSTQGHLNSDGLCFVKRNYASPR